MTPTSRQSVCSNSVATAIRTASLSAFAAEALPSPSDVLVPLPPALSDLEERSREPAAAKPLTVQRSAPPRQRQPRAGSECSEDSSRTQVESLMLLPAPHLHCS